MEFPTTPILDDFNRANTGPPPSASWTTDYYGAVPGLEVVGNQLACDARYGSAYWNTPTTGDHVEGYITASTFTNDALAIALICSDVGLAGYDGYEFYIESSGYWEVSRRDNGVGTDLVSSASHYSATGSGSSFGLRRVGYMVELWHRPSGGDWALWWSGTDGTYTSGPWYIGIYMDGRADLSSRCDDFGGGDVVMPTFPTTPVLDDFNRADQGPPPGRLWGDSAFYHPTANGNLVVVDQQLAAGARYQGGYLLDLVPTDDVEIYVQLTGWNSGATVAIDVLTTDSVPTAAIDGYELYAEADGYFLLQKKTAGASSTIADEYQPGLIAEGDYIGLRRSGTTVEVWHKPAAGSWSVLLEGTDTTHSGPWNLCIYVDGDAGLVQRLDNFGGGGVGVTRYLVDADFTSSFGEVFRLGYSAFGGSAPITSPLTATFCTADAVQDYTMRVSIRRGKDGQLETVRAGEASIVLSDPTGRFNPANAASDLYGLVRPMRQVRIRYDDGAGGTYGLFRGFVRNVTHDPSRDLQQTTLTCSDLLWYMGRSRPQVGTVTSVTAGTAIGLVLDAVGWTDPTLRSLSADGVTIAEFGASGDTSALELVRKVLEADRGEFFVDGDGVATYRGRNYRYAQTSAGTFSDTFMVARPQVDVEAMVNTASVVMATTAGVVTGTYTYTDADSVAAYGYLEAPEVQTSYLSGTVDAQSLAGYIVTLARDAFSPVSMNLMAQTDALRLAQAQRDLGDAITVVSDVAAIGTTEFFVEAIDHEVTDGGHYHRTSWVLSPDPSGTAGVFIIGTSTIDGAAGLGY